MKLVLLSDIHANLNALKAVRENLEKQQVEYCLLGDYIDYGPRPNEVIMELNQINPLVKLAGNHENSLMKNDLAKFATDRGPQSLLYTKSILNNKSNIFLSSLSYAPVELILYDKKILFIHGDFSDVFWGKMNYEEMKKETYKSYDFVISGHTHVPHLIDMYYNDNNPSKRNQKRVTFLNPGSVGQPRNHNNMAQYVEMDLERESISFIKVPYDFENEKLYFSNEIDEFYKNRLSEGI